MKIFFKIICILLALISLPLILISPVIGIILLVLSVLGIWKGSKIFDKKTPTNGEDQQKAESKTIKVAGISNFMDSVMVFADENEDYHYTESQIIKDGMEDEEIHEYIFRDHLARFEFEPKNPFDSNAIAIYINELQIGYVPKENIAFIRDLITSDRLKKATCKFVGGNFKQYNSETEAIETTVLDIGARIIVEYENLDK